mmetsp:Transcript_56187/g.167103  ORF Transcript_56187/g.167103 Transcript_56187/m.167103 type:complete len:357 (+) Transcript_56187:479-1549(+)
MQLVCAPPGLGLPTRALRLPRLPLRRVPRVGEEMLGQGHGAGPATELQILHDGAHGLPRIRADEDKGRLRPQLVQCGCEGQRMAAAWGRPPVEVLYAGRQRGVPRSRAMPPLGAALLPARSWVQGLLLRFLAVVVCLAGLCQRRLWIPIRSVCCRGGRIQSFHVRQRRLEHRQRVLEAALLIPAQHLEELRSARLVCSGRGCDDLKGRPLAVPHEPLQETLSGPHASILIPRVAPPLVLPLGEQLVELVQDADLDPVQEKLHLLRILPVEGLQQLLGCCNDQRGTEECVPGGLRGERHQRQLPVAEVLGLGHDLHGKLARRRNRQHDGRAASSGIDFSYSLECREKEGQCLARTSL